MNLLARDPHRPPACGFLVLPACHGRPFDPRHCRCLPPADAGARMRRTSLFQRNPISFGALTAAAPPPCGALFSYVPAQPAFQ